MLYRKEARYRNLQQLAYYIKIADRTAFFTIIPYCDENYEIKAYSMPVKELHK